MVYEVYFGGGDDLSEFSSFDSLVWFDSFRLDFVWFDSLFWVLDDYKLDYFGFDDNKEGFDDFKGVFYGYDYFVLIYENEELVFGMFGMYGFGFELFLEFF